jgi:GntR family transcriptional regulator/MocR family aminotransferase
MEGQMTTFSHAPVELPLIADRDGPAPLAAQIAAQLRAALAHGQLTAGERLPSTRALAIALGVSRTVVTAAYAQLFAEGWLEGRHGSGTYVAPGAPGVASAADGSLIAKDLRRIWPHILRDHESGSSGDGAGSVSLRPGVPWTDGIDKAAWRRAWRTAGAAPISSWPDSAGVPALRVALTGYLRRSRGVRCDPGQILVTRGVSASLSLLAMALLRPGDRVGIEEPGYPAARAVFAAHGAQVVPCRADADGLVVQELPADLRMIYTTPAHQYPLGGRLPVPRRQALIAWARAVGALIIEDDYDGEFRYDVAPLPALFGLDPEVVAYLGTTTKTLTPALGAGWLVAQPEIVAAIAETGAAAGIRVPEPVQHAVLAMLQNGDLERHVRRMRHDYARRRAAMVSLLGGPVSGGPVSGGPVSGGPVSGGLARLHGDTAGMHMFLELPAGADAAVATQAAARGVAVVTIQRYFAGPPARHGLVLGYGAANLSGVTRACQVLADILDG